MLGLIKLLTSVLMTTVLGLIKIVTTVLGLIKLVTTVLGLIKLALC